MPFISHVAIVVRDYDEAIAWYTDKAGFTLAEDRPVPAQNKRWVTMRPPNAPADTATVLFQRATTEKQLEIIGNQTGGRVFLFLDTDDFERDHRKMTEAGVEWVRQPKVEDYGTVAVWKDLYGNQWDLIQRTK